MFSTAALYYFSILGPQLDRTMVSFISCVSMAFIIRSTSLVGWLPLLLFKLFKNPKRYLTTFIKSLPIFIVLLGFSLFLD